MDGMGLAVCSVVPGALLVLLLVRPLGPGAGARDRVDRVDRVAALDVAALDVAALDVAALDGLRLAREVGWPGGIEPLSAAATTSVHRPSRRPRSDRNTPSGSTRSRTAVHSSTRGYMARNAAGESRESLAR